MNEAPESTEEWMQYQEGIQYNEQINHYNTVNKNERFYAGDQWKGVQANGLPTPVFNIFKRIINYFIASILSQNISVQFVPENVGDEANGEEEMAIKKASELVTRYSETLFEKLKMNQKTRQWLLDLFITGDAGSYNYWNSLIDTMQAIKGDICLEGVDSVNIFFGNPNDSEVQSQPYIIIAFRELVSNLRAQAEQNGIEQTKINLISADIETEYQSGDRAKIELMQTNSESGKCQALLKIWKVTKMNSDGVMESTVHAKKSTRYTEIRNEWNTKLSLYPVAWMNCDPRKNSYHGQAIGTGLAPNQIFINKTFAMAMMSLMHTAFPKAVYNKTLITAWNNQLGSAVGVENVGGEVNINNLATYLNPGTMSTQVFQLIDMAIKYTKDMLGATDAALGEIKPDNTSAIIAVQQSSAIPLETVKQNLYQFVEDNAYIWLDFMANYYGKRKVSVKILGKRVIEEFDFSLLKKMKFNIKVDVGPSSYWSQITAMQTLDNLLKADRITFIQYLDRITPGLIPKSKELIEDLQSQDTKQQFIWEQMAKFLETLPPEERAQLEQLSPEQLEAQLMQMMMVPPEQKAQQDAEKQAQQQSQQEQQRQLVLQQQEQDKALNDREQQKSDDEFTKKVILKSMDNDVKTHMAGLKLGSGSR